MNERLRRRLELRRSNAAQPHKSGKQYDRHDWAWWEELERYRCPYCGDLFEAEIPTHVLDTTEGAIECAGSGEPVRVRADD